MRDIAANFVPVNVTCIRKSFKAYLAQHIISSAQAASGDKKTIYFDPDHALWKQENFSKLSECKDENSPPLEVPEQSAPSNPLPPSLWGPNKWAEWHDDKVHTLTTINAFVASLPLTGCGCKKSFKDIIARNPPPLDSAPINVWQWWKKDRHDDINTELNKSPFTDADAIAKYGFEPRPPT